MLKHHSSWQQFAADATLDLRPDDIVLVRGWVKSSEWAVTAFQASSRGKNAFIEGGISAAHVGLSCHFGQYSGMMKAANSGPVTIADIDSPPALLHSTSSPLGAPGPATQCIFLCYYKIKYRRFRFPPKVIKAAAGPSNLPSEGPGDHEVEPVAAGSTLEPADDILIETETGPIPEFYSPTDAVLDYILENSDAEVAIACEGDISSLFPGREGEWPSDLKGYLDANLPLIHVDENKAGTLSLEAAIRREQQHRRTIAEQHQRIEEDSLAHEAVEAPVEKLVLPNGRSLQWLDVVLKDGSTEGVSINSFSISKNGERIATCSDNYSIKLWDLHSGEFLHDFLGHEDSVYSVAFSPDGANLVSGSADTNAIIWDVDSVVAVATLSDHTAWIWSAAYSPDASTIATGSFDQTVCLWAPNGDKRHTLTHDAQVTLLEFSPDSKSVLSCADSTAHLWDCATGNLIFTLDGHTGTIWSMKFSLQGDRIVTGSDDCTSRVWSADSGDELVTLREHSGPVWAVTFSPDGKSVISGSYDSTIAACDSFSGENQYHIRERPSRVSSLAYSNDGKYIASGDQDSLVKLWDALSGAFVAEFQGHRDRVKAVQWSPDDRSVVSSSDDGGVRVWSIRDMLRLQEI